MSKIQWTILNDVTNFFIDPPVENKFSKIMLIHKNREPLQLKKKINSGFP